MLLSGFLCDLAYGDVPPTAGSVKKGSANGIESGMPRWNLVPPTRATRCLGISGSPTPDNLSPKETTKADASARGTDEADLSRAGNVGAGPDENNRK